MPNKATAFTVVSAIGLCNLVAYVLFTTPPTQMASFTSYFPLSSLDSSDLTPNNNSRAKNVSSLDDEMDVQKDKNKKHEIDVKSTWTDKNVNRTSGGSRSTTSTTKTTTTTTMTLRDKRKTPRRQTMTMTTTTSLPLSTVDPPPAPRIDPHNYRYVINQPDLCGGSTDPPPLLVIFVCTSLGNFDARRAIRNTWGSVAKNAKSKKRPKNATSTFTSTNLAGVRLAFLLGRSFDDRVQSLVEAEAANFSDLIQEDFLDTYNNLTLKSVMMLKWVDAFCARAQFLLKTDDDMFIHVTNLVKYVHVVRKRKRLLFGRLMHGARPFRQRTSKWFAPTSTYRERVYPDYLSGTAYAMSTDVARALMNVTLRTPLFHLEDVFVTGICARRAGIPRRHYSGFTYERRPATGCAFRNAISGHKVSPAEMIKIWNELQQPQQQQQQQIMTTNNNNNKKKKKNLSCH